MEEFSETAGKIGRLASRTANRKRIPLGAWGEWVALGYLRRLQGWEIVARNWKSRRGEIDLIAFDEQGLVVVEVKTRRTPTLFPPESNIDEEKKNQLERLAFDFLYQYEIQDTGLRFDLIAVETPDLRRYCLRHYRGFM